MILAGELSVRVYRWPGSNDSDRLLRSRAAAYALYVLAKGSRADVASALFHDARMNDEPSPLARESARRSIISVIRPRRNAFRQAERAGIQ